MKLFDTAQSKGFTLIETVVALGILVLLLTLVAGSYGRFIGVQRDGIGQQEMQEDVRLFLQLFTREARTAFGNTYAILDQENTQDGVVFRNQEGHCVRYKFNSDAHTLERAEANPANLGEHCADPTIYGPPRTLTDTKNSVIANARFEAITAQPEFVLNTRPEKSTLDQQGLVTIQLEAHPAADQDDLLRLQTTVTSRQTTPYTWPE